MRYIAKKVKKEFEVSGIKEMEDIQGDQVEVLFATKSYNKKQLEEVINKYQEEFVLMNEKYELDMEDMGKILQAINDCK